MTRNALVAIGFCVSLGLSAQAHAGGTQFTSVAGGFSSQGCDGGGCWTNYIRVADITGDGALDVVAPNMQGLFSFPGGDEDLEVFENSGDGTFTDIAATAVNGHVARIRQVAIGDVDGDGDLDMYAPDGANQAPDAYFINDGSGVFTNEADTLLPGLSSNAGGARFADIDADGDLDLILADGYASSGNDETLHFYLNDGMGMMTEAVGAAPGEANGVDIGDIDIADFDRDFDLDVLINPHSGNLTLWLNDGAGVFTESAFPGVGAGSNFHYNPAVCDVDGDGDIDVMVDNTGGNYSEQLLVNDGSAGFTDQTAQITGNSGADDNGVACADIDNDGDFDAVVINVAGGGGFNLRLFTNDGAGSFSATPGVFPDFGCALWAEFGELSGDGRLDVVVGAGECGNQNRVYHATDAVPVDDRPPVILANEEIAGPVDVDAEPGAVRFAVSDRFVTDSGAQLQSAHALLFPGGAEETVPAVYMGGDLYRVVLPPQSADVTVTYQLCATDPQGNTGCTAELTYDVGRGGDPGGTATGSGTDTGNGVDDTNGMVDDTSGESMTGATNAMTMGGMTSPGTGSDTEGTGSGATDDGGSGCSCTTAGVGQDGRGSTHGLLGLLGLIGLLVPIGLRRRLGRG